MQLAVIIDLYSRRVAGGAMDRRMNKTLVIRALLMTIDLGQPAPGLIHHPDRGSQYASHAYQKLLRQHERSGKYFCWLPKTASIPLRAVPSGEDDVA